MPDGLDGFAQVVASTVDVGDAERGVIACALADETREHKVVARATQLLGAGDFGNAHNAAVWTAILAVTARGNIADTLTIAEELGGDARAQKALAEAASLVVLPAAVEQYAERVAAHAYRRTVRAKLREAYQRADAPGSPVDAVTSAHEVLASMPRGPRARRDDSMHASVEATIARILARYEAMQRGERATARWGVAALDGFTNEDGGFFEGAVGGLFPGKLYVIAGVPAAGKAQPLDAKVLTPFGFRRMGDIAVGDEVIGSDGKPHAVVGVYPQGVKPVFRVTMGDGTSTECCDDHLWYTQTRSENVCGHDGSAKPLSQIRATLKTDKGVRHNHHVPVVSAVEFDGRPDLPMPPYLLGLILGDGDVSARGVKFTNTEADIRARFSDLLPPEDCAVDADAITMRVRRVQKNNDRSETAKTVDALGLGGTDCYGKFIPPRYMMAPVAERLELLRGLFDSDGHVERGKRAVEYTTSSPRLAADVAFLARSLGAIVSVSRRFPRFTVGGQPRVSDHESFRFQVRFPNGFVPVSSEKHLAKWGAPDTAMQRRWIDTIEPVGEKECQCIAIDAPDHLYVTDDFIVTHNTTLAWQATLATARGDECTPGKRVLVFSLEMSREDICQRLAAQACLISEARIENGGISGGEANALIRFLSDDLASLPINIITSCRTIEEMRARVLAEMAAGDVGLVVIDFLQRAKMGRRSDDANRDDQDRVYEAKGIANEGVPVLAISSMSKASQVRANEGKVSVADTSGSGTEYAADFVAFLIRVNPEDKGGKVEVKFDVAKRRNGPASPATLMLDLNRGVFETVARKRDDGPRNDDVPWTSEG